MVLDIAAVQTRLRQEGLDGWLLYDFHGSNPISARLAGVTDGAHMTTRRWYYLIPADEEPRGLIHAIERRNLDRLPGMKIVYAQQGELERGLTKILKGMRRVAMEYSPGGAIPYLSRVDAGTMDNLRERGLEIVSSGDLAQAFEAVWSPEQLASHEAAAAALYRIKDLAFTMAAEALRTGQILTEYELQQQMVRWFNEENLVSDSAPVVAVGSSAGDPHYLPTASRHRNIVPEEILLLDLWGKQQQAGSVFADITWVGFAGTPPPEVTTVFRVVATARDAALELVKESAKAGRELRGWQADRAARQVLESAGYGQAILHRTGHNLGESVHGNGAHLDDYETHDDRRLEPGTGFTIEPGLYFDSFGVRTEINVFLGEHEARVTGPCQTELVPLL
jgi:Xaa-Pro aminopeptidase